MLSEVIGMKEVSIDHFYCFQFFFHHNSILFYLILILILIFLLFSIFFSFFHDLFIFLPSIFSLLGRLVVQTIEKLNSAQTKWTYVTSFPVERRGFLSSLVGVLILY
jgi:hypothetical protein